MACMQATILSAENEMVVYWQISFLGPFQSKGKIVDLDQKEQRPKIRPLWNSDADISVCGNECH